LLLDYRGPLAEGIDLSLVIVVVAMQILRK